MYECPRAWRPPPRQWRRLKRRRAWGSNALKARDILIVVCLITVASMGFWGARTGYGAVQQQYVLALVRQGDTLWDIALRVAGPDADIRHIVYLIRKANALKSSTIMPGDVLRVPFSRKN